MFRTRGLIFKPYEREVYLNHKLAQAKKALLKDCPSREVEEKEMKFEEGHESIKKNIFKIK